MATVRDIAHGALRRIEVLDIGEEADPEMAEVAVAAFNGIMHELVLAGWLTTHTTQALGDTLALGDAYIEPLKAAVAVRIAPDFAKMVSPRLGKDAARFMAQIAAHNYTPQTFERGFRFEDVDEFTPDNG